MQYVVYILECSDNTLYTGITNNLDRRIKEHNSPNSKTKYTRCRQPVKLLKYFTCENRAAALHFEYQIKKLSKTQKLKLIAKYDGYMGSIGFYTIEIGPSINTEEVKKRRFKE